MDDNERRIGALRVPRMALGTMYFGTRVDEQSASGCLDIAADLGATLWDTANNYAFWAGGRGDESESVIGRWFASRGAAARDRVVLASKVGARPLPGYADLEHVAGLSARAIREQTIDSLRRLQTDHLDILYTHIDDRSVPIADTVGAVEELVNEGLVREMAFSNVTSERLSGHLAVQTAHPCRALQQRFTYLRPAPDVDIAPQIALDETTEEIAAGAGIALLGYSSLLSGAYTNPERALPDEYATVDNHDRLQTLREVAPAAGLDPGQLVLAWMTQRPHAVTPIVGASRPDQMQSAWTAVTTPLPPTVVADLETR